MKWTEGQQKVIDLRERNILVSAAAGSGKTAVLVERIIQKITNQDKPVDIDRLLVVTFTKAAAAEMRGRISEALEERAKENPKDENLQKQLRLLHNAQITTIDSFCQYIIRNYFPVIGLDPLFQVADETDLKLMKQDVLENLMEDHFEEARKENNQAFLNFTEIFAPGRNDKPIDELILKLYTISQSYPQPEVQLKKWDQMYQIASVQELMETSWMQELMLDVREAVQGYAVMAAEAERICLEEGGPEVYLDTIRSDLRQIHCLAEAEDYSALYEAMTTFHPGRLKAARGKEIDPEKRDLVKDLRGSYLKNGVQKLQKELFFQTPDEMCRDIQAMASPVHELIQITLDFAEAFAAEKQDRGLIDFNDMEHFALRILVDMDEDGSSAPSAVARELQQHYEEILTDEYQDSNFVQETILTSLCRAPEQAPYLFMVGDVKQSIYQFRLARPDLFMEKYNSYSTEDSKMQRIDLHQNFRSRATVLESANYLFERLMREDFGGIVYDEAARLVPGAMFPDSDCRHAGVRQEGQTEILLVEQKSASESKKHSSDGIADDTGGADIGEEGTELGKRALEAAVIGERIRELVQGEQPLYVHDKGGYRPVEYRDIVILLRSLSGWSEEFIETLTDMGIPAYSATKTGYFATLEVETMLDFLRIIDNPRQDIPLVAVMRSGLFGITDEELAYLGTVCGTVNYWDAVCQVVAGTEQLQIPEDMREQLQVDLSCFMDRLKSYQELAKIASVYELLHKIYYETGYYSVMSAMPAGEKRAANLDILLQQAVEFADNGHRGIFEFCRYIESLRKSDIDFGEASIYGENTNAVQIMSIHKSKGLEFPVVFVAGMGKQFNLMDCNRSVIMDMDYGIGAEYMDLELRVKQPTLLHCFMKRHVRQSTLTEETRILYVALTRAKEKLYLTGTVSGLEKKMTDWQQKGQFLNRMSLLSARTYLDWIMPALAERTAYVRCMEEVMDSQAGDSMDADPLYRIRLQSPEEIVHGEAMELMGGLLRKQELESWDDSIVRDAEMEELIRCYEGYCYPYQQEADVPVKISVSELKRRAMIQADALAEEVEEVNLRIGESEYSNVSDKLDRSTGTEMMGEADGSDVSDKPDRSTETEIMGKADGSDVSDKLDKSTGTEIMGEADGLDVYDKSDRSTEIEKTGDSNCSKLSLQQDIPRPSFRKEQTELTSAERGTLYHLVMEQLPYQDLVPGYDMNGLLNSLVRDGYMTAEEKDTLSVKRFT
ncbi:MAG: helicase-exonuclease AddAB subunit AddA, partial [Lachnospiraceae bacterium]|nr:helicase-exonuclease AddAB subunit AddA [Lachnospiraceae bacterium]